MTVETPWGERPSNDHRRLTPDRVRNKDFSRTKLGHRGYSEEEVRAFLYRVADDIATGDMEKADLRAEVERLKNWYKERGTDVDNSGAKKLSVDAVNLLSRAQQTADAQIAEAEDYARRLVGQARQQYEQMLNEAQQQAEEAGEPGGRRLPVERRAAVGRRRGTRTADRLPAHLRRGHAGPVAGGAGGADERGEQTRQTARHGKPAAYSSLGHDW